jgi:hypothetical protein
MAYRNTQPKADFYAEEIQPFIAISTKKGVTT